MRIGVKSVHKYKEYLLQQLKGCVLAFSYYQLHPNAKLCMRIRRVTDDAILDVGFRNGYIDLDSVNTFLNGVNAGIAIWYNQVQDIPSATNAINTDNSKQPLFNAIKGITFNGLSNYLSITPYNEMDLHTEPISFYFDFYKTGTGTSQYLFCKNSTGSADRQYGAYVSYVDGIKNTVAMFFDGSGRSYPEPPAEPSTKIVSRWQVNTATTWKIFNEHSFGDNYISDFGSSGYTIAQTGTHCYIGCRSNTGNTQASWFAGNVKSVLLFNTRQSKALHSTIKRLGV